MVYFPFLDKLPKDRTFWIGLVLGQAIGIVVSAVLIVRDGFTRQQAAVVLMVLILFVLTLRQLILTVWPSKKGGGR